MRFIVPLNKAIACTVIGLLSAVPGGTTPTAASSEASGKQLLVQDLQILCNGRHNQIDACRFYILGVFEGAILEQLATKGTKNFCTPDDLSQVEMVEVVKRLMAQDVAKFPTDTKLPAVSLIVAFIQHNYPCSSVK